MVVKVIRALNQPDESRMIKVIGKPRFDGITDLNIVMPIPPVVLREMEGSPSAYFNATVHNGVWKFYGRVEPPKD